MSTSHLFMSLGDDSLRLYQVQQLLAWIDSRKGAAASIVCGDFNAPLTLPSAALMASRFRPTQTGHTAFTPLADNDGSVSHPEWARMDRCIDYIWVSERIEIAASGVCFDRPDPADRRYGRPIMPASGRILLSRLSVGGDQLARLRIASG